MCNLVSASMLIGLGCVSQAALGQAWYVEAPLPAGIQNTNALACSADGTVVVGLGRLQSDPTRTAAIIARLLAPGVAESTAYAPPAPYTSCSITCVNSDGTAFGGWVEAGGQARFPAFFSPVTGWFVLGAFPSANVSGISEDGQLLMGQQFVNNTAKAAIFGVGIGGLLPTTTIEGKVIEFSGVEGGVLTLDGYALTGRAIFTDGTTGIVQWFLAPPFSGTQILPRGLQKAVSRTVSSRDGQRMGITYAFLYPTGSLGSTNVGTVATGGTDFTFPLLAPDDGAQEANSVTNDGQIMTGVNYDGAGRVRSSVWRGTVRHDLFNLLVEGGASVNPAFDSTAMGSNQAGDLFIGTVRPGSNDRRIFFAKVTIPGEAEECLADFNGDGFIDFFDYIEFVEAFESGC